MESQLARAYGWSPGDIAGLEWLSVWQFHEASVRQEAEHYSWLLGISNSPHLAESSDRQPLLSALRKMHGFSWSYVPDIYDRVTPEERRRLIGSAVSLRGNQWLEDRPRQKEWLRESGASPEQCVAEFWEYYLSHGGVVDPDGEQHGHPDL